MTRLRLAALALGLLATTRTVGAQERGGAACLAAIPADSLVRTVVFLEADVADSAARGVLPAGDLLADLLAQRVRATLGAETGVLPRGDAVVGWAGIDNWLAVTLHRDGRFTWRPLHDAPSPDTVPRGGAAVLARALADLAADEHRLFWPEELAGDTATFELHLHRSAIRRSAGQPVAEPLGLRLAVPVFSLPVPTSSPVVPTREARITYPPAPLDGNAIGTVVLDFVVDTTGRVDPATIREVWPSDRPRLTGELGRYYDAFVRSATRGVREARYEPARIGGCVVRQRARQAFEYKIRP